jgi:hypothetical protein
VPKYLKQSGGLQNKQTRTGHSSGGKHLKQNTPAAASGVAQLRQVRKRVLMQAGLAGFTIVLTVIIIFAMSAAWYTNIVQTNGLVFEVKEWGFDGNIVTNTEAIQAGPGDDGLISLVVESQSDDICSVSVGVTKTKMPREIQQRLYFYVDAKTERGGETLERIYLNSQDSYTYLLFSQGVLTLTETAHNDSQLKWHWVYDVLGYYVLGSATGAGDVIVSECLRPIEYDYDMATMTYVTDDSGNIVGMEMETVDGETTMEDFLVTFSETDGYEGKIDPEKKLVSGYYPVDVDENGNGVYAYLCTYTEIEMATLYDTKLGEDAVNDENNVLRYEATLLVSAQKNKNNIVNVTTLAGLMNAVEAGGADVIQLSSNITIGEDEILTVNKGQQAMLDLNRYEILSQSDEVPIQLKEGGSLTLSNGTLTTDRPDNTYAITTIGAELVLSNVEVNGFNAALKVIDDDASNTGVSDSVIRMINCYINTNVDGIIIYGNGTKSALPTRLILDNTTIHCTEFGICGNGTATKHGTDIQILNSEIVCNPYVYNAGVYQPQGDSTLTIYNSKISAYTGVAIKGGSVSVVDSTITGKGPQTVPEKFANSGFVDTGDAIYVETNYGTPILLEISGDTVLNSDNSYSLQVFEPDAKNVKIRIYSGTFQMLPDKELFRTYVAAGSACELTEHEGSSTCAAVVYIPEPEPESEPVSEQGSEPAESAAAS